MKQVITSVISKVSFKKPAQKKESLLEKIETNIEGIKTPALGDVFSEIPENFKQVINDYISNKPEREPGSLLNALETTCNDLLKEAAVSNVNIEKESQEYKELEKAAKQIEMSIKGRKGNILDSEPPRGFKDMLCDLFSKFVSLFSKSLSASIASDKTAFKEVNDSIKKITDIYKKEIEGQKGDRNISPS